MGASKELFGKLRIEEIVREQKETENIFEDHNGGRVVPFGADPNNTNTREGMSVKLKVEDVKIQK